MYRGLRTFALPDHLFFKSGPVGGELGCLCVVPNLQEELGFFVHHLDAEEHEHHQGGDGLRPEDRLAPSLGHVACEAPAAAGGRGREGRGEEGRRGEGRGGKVCRPVGCRHDWRVIAPVLSRQKKDGGTCDWPKLTRVTLHHFGRSRRTRCRCSSPTIGIGCSRST